MSFSAPERASLRLLNIVAARPNFMKMAPVIAAMSDWREKEGDPTDTPPLIHLTLVHTGQHYDPRMSDVFLRDLALPRPDYHLDIGSGTHAEQTADVLKRLEPVLIQERPHLVLVAGDVNSTLAAALCAAKLQIPVAHVEAGLRSEDRTMPEELNRLLTDQLADLLFTTERTAIANLEREGVPRERIHFVGNTMIDSLDCLRDSLDVDAVLAHMDLSPRDYALVTLHRPSNVDDSRQLDSLLSTLLAVSKRLPVVWPVHVRTRQRLLVGNRQSLLQAERGFVCCEALPYPDFLAVMSEARVVLTDSGGIQEETTVLGVPCLTLRTSTERPVTITEGTNRLVDPYEEAAILRAVDEVLAASMPSPVRPELWDGHAAERIVAVIADWAQKNL